MDARNADAYLGLALIGENLNKVESLGLLWSNDRISKMEADANYKKFLRFATEEQKQKTTGLLNLAKQRLAEYEKLEAENRARLERADREQRLARIPVLKKRRDELASLQGTLAAKKDYTVGLRSDGTVVAVGDDDYAGYDVSDWTDIVDVAVTFRQIIGLRADGTMVEVGNRYNKFDVSGWTNISAFAVGGDHIVGLRTDGTVIAAGESKHGQCDVSTWTNIIAVAAGDWHTVGLRADGTVVAAGGNSSSQCDVSTWTNIVAVAAGDHHTVGLRADGTMVASGVNAQVQCDISSWKDIVAFSGSYFITGGQIVGLKADGTVIAAGENKDGQCEVCGWRDIVAVAAGWYHTVGLKADGTVVAVGRDSPLGYYTGRGLVSEWTDIVAIAAGIHHTVGLKADGTVVATGANDHGQCDVSAWKLFDSVDALKAERKAMREKAAAEHKEKVESLNTEKAQLQAELPTIKGLFSGGKRRQIESRLAEIEAELKKLG
jgi:alpha-tubulin suppressor-like RCC1 family protein